MRQAMALVAAFGIIAQDPAFARPAPPEGKIPAAVTWEELAGFVVARRISVKVPDGTRLEGEALAVRPDAIVLDVQKSSNRKLHPKGQGEVSRQGITEILVLREGLAIFRILGGVGGAIGGLMLSVGMAVAADNGPMALLGLLVFTPLAAAGGYYAGKLADRRATRIRIETDPALGVAR
jgi:hypothetical protein